MSIDAQEQADAGTGHPQEVRSSSFVSMPFLRSAARRRRRFWLATAALGLLLGAGMHLIVPRKYSAVTSLILTEPIGVDAAQAMANDQSLLQSTAVATRALALLHLNRTPAQFASSYHSKALSTEILSVSLTAGSPSVARVQARALAHAFLGFRSEELGRQVDGIDKGLSSQIAKLQQSVNSLTAAINAASGPSAPLPQTDTLANLVSARGAQESQISNLQGQIQQNQLDLNAVQLGSTILDPAAVSASSGAKVALADGLSGLIAGLGLGLAVVWIGAILSLGVRRRDEVAATLRAPVEMGVTARIGRGPRRRTRLRHLVRDPDAAHAQVQEWIIGHLEGSPGRALVVVPVPWTDVAGVAVAGAALRMTSRGQGVTLVDLAEGRPLRRLLGSGSPSGSGTGAPAPGAGQLHLMTPPPDGRSSPSPVPAGDLLLIVATLDPNVGAEHLSGWSSQAVVVVSTGRASRTRLSTTREMLSRAAVDLRAVLLLHPDTDDDSLGAPPGEPGPTGDRDPDSGDDEWLTRR